MLLQGRSLALTFLVIVVVVKADSASSVYGPIVGQISHQIRTGYVHRHALVIHVIKDHLIDHNHHSY